MKLLKWMRSNEPGLVMYYRGYSIVIQYEPADHSYHGVIEDIDDCVTWLTHDSDKVDEEFCKAVDDYVELCDNIKKDPG